MTTEELPVNGDWVPDSCTLPTAERPLRVEAFGDLFASAVVGVTRDTPTRLALVLRAEPAVAARVADLMVQEVGCCGFFTFALVAGTDGLRLDITVPEEYQNVLDGIAEQAA